MRDYAPNHYVSEEDMQGRTAAFEIMRHGLALQDAADVLYEKKIAKRRTTASSGSCFAMARAAASSHWRASSRTSASAGRTARNGAMARP